jgi:acyl carrier protein
MEKVNEILVKTFKISMDDAQKNLIMDDVDRWDSITHMDLIVRIEDEFHIQIDGDDIAEMITFDAIRNTVNKYTL